MTINNEKKPGLLVPDRKIVDLKGKPLPQNNTPREPVEVAPEEPQGPTLRAFQFSLVDSSKDFSKKGFIIATNSFIGLAVGQGEIVALVPMAELRAVVAQDVEVTLDQVPSQGNA